MRDTSAGIEGTNQESRAIVELVVRRVEAAGGDISQRRASRRQPSGTGEREATEDGLAEHQPGLRRRRWVGAPTRGRAG